MTNQTPLPQDLRNNVSASLAAFLKATQGRNRKSQKVMIGHTTRTLYSGSPGISVIEAGTGTGKTVGYLIPAIHVAQAKDLFVVVATATIPLQTQLIEKDIPALIASGAVDVDPVLAKGRQRYLCPIKLENARQASQTARYPDEELFTPKDYQKATLKGMHDHFQDGLWDGDLDNWDAPIESELRSFLTTDHAGCRGRNCEAFNDCPYYAARERLENANLIVANHDLVLSDIGLGGGVVLPPPEQCIYVFDEAHQLADKALGHQNARFALSSNRDWLKSLEKQLDSLAKKVPDEGSLNGYISTGKTAISGCLSNTDVLYDAVMSFLKSELTSTRYSQTASATPVYRYPPGQIPSVQEQAAEQIKGPWAGLLETLGRLVEWLKAQSESDNGKINRDDALGYYELLNKAKRRAEDSNSLLAHWKSSDAEGPEARWVELARIESLDQIDEADLVLNFSPASAGHALKEELWKRCGGAILTSATLAIGGRFDHCYQELGLGKEATCLQLESPFDYPNQGSLIIPEHAADPTDTTAHDASIIQHIESRVASKHGVLVLFSSKRQLDRVFESLSSKAQDVCLSQQMHSRREMIERHKIQRANGKTSILLGLQSLAEGIDLPGELLTEVVVTRLPFAQPDDPIRATKDEWTQANSGSPFMQNTLPRASLVLRQAVGRLIRSETDRGDIVFLDKRVTTKRYGKDLLADLPPFRRA